MTKWKRSKLEDYVDLLTGYPFKSSNFSDNEEDVALVKGDNLHQKYIDWDKAKRWDINEFDKLAKFQLFEGDIVIAMDRPWIEAGLKVAWIKKNDPKSLLVQRVSRLRGINGLDTTFLRYIVVGPEFCAYLKNIVTGVNVPHISGKQILNYKFDLPPLKTQKKIAAILSNYDDLIENNNQRISLLEEMAAEIYKEWFVRLRFPGYKTAKFFDKDGNEVPHGTVGALPEGWEKRKLKDVVDFIVDPIKPDEILWTSSLKYLPIDIIPRKSMFLANSDSIENAQSSLIGFKKGDIIFGAMRAYFHKVILAPFDGVTRKTCFVLRPKSLDYFSFMYLTMFQDSTVGYAASNSKGSTIPYTFWNGGLDKLRIIVPKMEIMKEYNRIVKPMLDFILEMHYKNQTLQETRDLLLPRLISGKLNVENINLTEGTLTETNSA